MSFIRSFTTICSAPRPPGGGLQHWAMRALSASISLTDMVVSVPFDCPRTLLGAGSSDGSTGAGSSVASGILLSSAAIRSVLKSGFLVTFGAGFFGLASACFGLAGFSSFLASTLGAGFGVSALSSALGFSSGFGLSSGLSALAVSSSGLVASFTASGFGSLGFPASGASSLASAMPALILVTSDGVARSTGMAMSGACSILAAGKATSAKSRIAVCSAAEMKVLLPMMLSVRDFP